MKNSQRNGQAPPAKAFLSRKTLLILAAIGAVGIAFFGFQEVVLRIAGYKESLYDDSSQRVEISGKVVDKETLKPVTGAEVAIYGSDVRCLTDDKGSFSLTLPAGWGGGNASISIEKDGYNLLLLDPNKYSDSERAELEFCLSRQTTANGSE
jgi:hypothetical protein